MIIESHEELRQAVVQLDFYMEFARSPDECLWLETLAKAIEAYELIHFPVPEPTPEEAAAFRAEQEKMPSLEVLNERVSDAAKRVCRAVGHMPIEKMGAIICDRCGEVLRER